MLLREPYSVIPPVNMKSSASARGRPSPVRKLSQSSARSAKGTVSIATARALMTRSLPGPDRSPCSGSDAANARRAAAGPFSSEARMASLATFPPSRTPRLSKIALNARSRTPAGSLRRRESDSSEETASLTEGWRWDDRIRRWAGCCSTRPPTEC